MNYKKHTLTAATLGLMALVGSKSAEAQQLKVYSWTNLPKIAEPTFKKDTFNILKYGAKPDGVTLNTQSINDAIDACSKKGGGVVLVPPGLWVTGPIELKNNVNLHLVRAAVLQFTNDFSQYKLVEGNWEGKRSARNQSPISGTDLQNIAITGKGIVDGGGPAWWMAWRDRHSESEWKKKVAAGGVLSEDGRVLYPSEKAKLGSQTKNNGILENGKTLQDFEEVKDYLRPNLLVLTNCKKVLLEGLTFQNSPAWNLHPLLCEDLTVRNVFAKNPWYAPNGDGIDIESCKNVLVEGCTFDVGDDGICIKSGRDEEGRRRGKPTENAIIRNNVVYHAHGGFVVGSEMSGGARNIFVSGCNFLGTDKGIRFKTTRGRGGIVENIYIKDIFMEDIVQEAVFFDMYYFVKAPAPGTKAEVPPVTEATPQFRDIYINNVVCRGANKGIFVRGLPEMNVKNIVMQDLVLQADKGAEIIEATDIQLKNVRLYTKKTDPVVLVENSKGIRIDGLDYNNNAALLFNVTGDRTADIRVSNTDAKKAQKAAAFGDGAQAAVLQIK